MKKTGKCSKRWVNPQSLEPKYIIINKYSQVFTGLIGGEPDWSDDVLRAKQLQGQSKFDTLQRHYYIKIEQMFL
jgi:hypothetical protein